MQLSGRKHRGFVAVLILAALQAGIAGTSPTPPPTQWPKVSHLIGMTVEDRGGQNVGKLHDLAFDPRTSRAQYAIIASGGILSVGRTLRAVPVSLVSAATAKRDTIAVHVSKRQLQNAPVIRSSELLSLGNPDRVREIRHFYDPLSRQVRNIPPTNRPPESGSPRALAPTGREIEAPLKLAGDLLGASVVSRQRERIGEILELLADLNGPESNATVWAIVSAGKFFRDHDHEYLVSLRAFQFPPHERIVLDVDRAALEQAPAYSPNRAAVSTGKPEIFRYHHRD